MVDPLTQVVSLLQPRAELSKVVTAHGVWRVRRTEAGRPFYCAALDGSARLLLNDREPLVLEKGDFLLIPAAFDFAMESIDQPSGRSLDSEPTMVRPGAARIGDEGDLPVTRMLVGYCSFGSSDAALLVSLLPQLVHVWGERRLTILVKLVDEESRGFRPGREVILSRLLEVLLIEALRATAGPSAAPGLLRGLGDERLAAVLRRIHEEPRRPWTVGQLAREAALSRSSFFERFRRAVGVAPMEYLLGWRMALAKDLLRRGEGGVAEVAERIGYGSASTFSVAFARHVGMAPTAYARMQRVP
ncbi:AraC family transcriptional regulator [Consotaella salsifontis]|uniref:Transcriptional regulator, AraC family n=1 Tax=Consotaella salsifontis TaxID=1365950 RepID=A0A1T4LF73_9HYPH|nr:AraC family transcriptional regulator [Consotaella salsifontis]SJZ53323.1 transcriptional regulator, AraC family [Consotaella salsifontis]